MFGWKKNNERIKEGGEQEQNEWEMMADEVRQEREQNEKLDRQKNKMIEAVLRGNETVLGQKEVEQRPGSFERFAKMIERGELTEDDERRLIGGIMAPMKLKGTTKMYDEGIRGDERKMWILASAIGENDYHKMESGYVGGFLKNYPMPMDFDENAEALLKFVGDNYGEQVKDDYAGAMGEFKKAMYGKQQEYWDVLKTLKKEAGEWSAKQENGAEKSAEKSPEKRQRDKLIHATLTGDGDVFGMSEVPEAPGEYDEYLERVNDGRINRSTERQTLSMIAGPQHKARGVNIVYGDKIAGDKHQERILAAHTSVGFENYRDVDERAVAEFWAKYPMPMDFERVSEDFVKSVQGEAKRKEYQEAMEQFKKTMYGKRQEYWERMKELRSEAEERKQNKDDTMLI